VIFGLRSGSAPDCGTLMFNVIPSSRFVFLSSNGRFYSVVPIFFQVSAVGPSLIRFPWFCVLSSLEILLQPLPDTAEAASFSHRVDGRYVGKRYVFVDGVAQQASRGGECGTGNGLR